MSVAIKITDPNGVNLSTRQFQRGQAIVVAGHVTGLLGLGEPFTHVQLEIPEVNFLHQTTTGLFGNFSIGVVLPNRDVNLTLKITATFTLSGQDQVVIPISVGSYSPEPLPEPPQQGGSYSSLLWGVAGIALAAIVLPPLLTSRSTGR